MRFVELKEKIQKSFHEHMGSPFHFTNNNIAMQRKVMRPVILECRSNIADAIFARFGSDGLTD